jgi:hypothetical protein
MPVPVIAPQTTVVSAGELLSSAFGEEFIILNLKDGIYYGLDHVGARVWTLIKKPMTVGAVRDTLVAEYDVEPAQCERDLVALLEDLVAKGLVQLEVDA